MLTPAFARALRFAVRLHGDQVRTGTAVPYVAHLLGVAALVLEDGGDEDEAIAALLHDTLEDHPRGGRTARRIAGRFGPRVLRIVRACTDTQEPGELRTPETWRARKERYLAHIPQLAPDERRVALADKVHNARALLADHARVGEAVWARFDPGRDERLWYYRALVDAFLEGGVGALLEELDRTVTALETAATTIPRAASENTTRRREAATPRRAPAGAGAEPRLPPAGRDATEPAKDSGRRPGIYRYGSTGEASTTSRAPDTSPSRHRAPER